MKINREKKKLKKWLEKSLLLLFAFVLFSSQWKLHRNDMEMTLLHIQLVIDTNEVLIEFVCCTCRFNEEFVKCVVNGKNAYLYQKNSIYWKCFKVNKSAHIYFMLFGQILMIFFVSENWYLIDDLVYCYFIW